MHTYHHEDTGQKIYFINHKVCEVVEVPFFSSFFRKCIIKYLEAQLVAQDSIATEWERYLPEIQQVSI